MGKWTPDYLDDVLHAKISSLVTGAINRAAVEKEPTISYEAFVRELDTGDSFTTSLVDILVKELAERRTRPSVNDRRLIADRTAKSLRLLATPLRIYRERGAARSHFTRRSANWTEYLNAPPNEMELDEDEDEFDNMLDGGMTMEGTRISSDLYDALGAHPHPWSASIPPRRTVISPSPPLDEGSTTTRASPGSRSGPWSMPSAAAGSLPSTSLIRQPSIRRPPRSRTVDFNDFTHRRRSTIRDTLSVAEGVTEPRENNWVRTSQPTVTRRFFPFSRARRHEATSTYPWAEVADSLGSDAPESVLHFDVEPSATNGAWGPISMMPTPSASSSDEASSSGATEDRPQPSAPRLRRGGVHASESMLSQHVSPVLFMPSSVDPSTPLSPQTENDDRGHSNGEPASYPTPGSTENENVT